MPTTTTRLALPSPTGTESADGPAAFNALTAVLDPKTVVFTKGTTAARPAAGVDGRFYYNTDTKRLEYDNGTFWVNNRPEMVDGPPTNPSIADGLFGFTPAGGPSTWGEITGQPGVPTTYVNLARAGPVLIAFGAQALLPNPPVYNAYMSVFLTGATVASPAGFGPQILTASATCDAAGRVATFTRMFVLPFNAGITTAQCKFAYNAGSLQIASPWLTLSPL
jgi:hypothetical protein